MADCSYAHMGELQQQHHKQLVQRLGALNGGSVMKPLSRIVFLATKVGLGTHLREAHYDPYDSCPSPVCKDTRDIVECVDEIDREEGYPSATPD